MCMCSVEKRDRVKGRQYGGADKKKQCDQGEIESFAGGKRRGGGQWERQIEEERGGEGI